MRNQPNIFSLFFPNFFSTFYTLNFVYKTAKILQLKFSKTEANEYWTKRAKWLNRPTTGLQKAVSAGVDEAGRGWQRRDLAISS
jgi:hypothetical protein